MTSSRTDLCVIEAPPGFGASEDEPVEELSAASAIPVCWSIAILVARGIPGISFCAIAFRIVDFPVPFLPMRA
jgi:hypothetical protein